MIGIYKATNLVNGKSYIGQSINFSIRKKNHLNRAFNPLASDYDCLFHRAIRKYGKDNFQWQLIEECLPEQLNERESYWIAYYHTYIYDKDCNGYNMTKGGDSVFSMSPEIVEQIIYDLQHTNLSQSDIAKKYNVHQTTVSDINIGDTWLDLSLDYPLRKKSILLGTGIQDKCPICGKTKTNKAKVCLNCYLKEHSSNIPPRDKLKQLIRTTPFTTIGKMYDVSDNAVRKWCDKYGLPRNVYKIKTYSDEEWKQI